MNIRITHIGGPTALIEIGDWRLLTDPTFDPPGGRYFFGWGTVSRKLAGPSLTADEVGPVDAVLLSHDQHEDNLDHEGRAYLLNARTVITTQAGARRLGGNVRGLPPWATTRLEQEGRVPIQIQATPCRHGPPGSRPIVGEVAGFALTWKGQEHGALWVTGDTVLYDGVRQVPRRIDVGTVVVHLGAVTFPWLSGLLRYTMNAQEAVELCAALDPTTIVPIHYEGWKHFRQGRAAAEAVFAASPLGDRVKWLVSGQPATLAV